jgi:hypothetical protein
MTKKIKCFNYEIIKSEIPNYLYSDKELERGIYDTFASEIVVSYGDRTLEQNGQGLTTCDIDNSLVTNLPNINPIINYVSEFIIKEFYGSNCKNEIIFYNRMWMNLIHKDCSGKCHTHNGINDGTAIFYYKVPKNGSKLIILKHDIGLESVEEKHKDISEYIDVKTGDLIIHKRDVPHAVSKHMSDDPRICFIFDFRLKKKIIYS